MTFVYQKEYKSIRSQDWNAVKRGKSEVYKTRKWINKTGWWIVRQPQLLQCQASSRGAGVPRTPLQAESSSRRGAGVRPSGPCQLPVLHAQRRQEATAPLFRIMRNKQSIPSRSVCILETKYSIIVSLPISYLLLRKQLCPNLAE